MLIIGFIIGLLAFGVIEKAYSSDSKYALLVLIIVAVLFFIRAFRPPVKWWQGILLFLGSVFLANALDILITYKNLPASIIGFIICTPFLFFGFRSFKEKNDTIPPSQNLPKEYIRLATFEERLSAWIIDFFIISLASVISWLILSFAFPDWKYEFTRLPKLAGSYIGLICFGILLEVIPTSLFGQSIGKKFLGLKVVSDIDDKRNKAVSYKSSFFRFIIKYSLSTFVLCLGGLWILFNKKRKSWHDFILRSHIIKHIDKDQKSPDWVIFFKSIFQIKAIFFIVSTSLIICILFFSMGWGRKKSKWILQTEKIKNHGDYTKAIVEYNNIIEKYPGFALSYRKRGELLLEAGKIDKSIRDHEATVRLHSRDLIALDGLIHLYLAKAKLLDNNHTIFMINPELIKSPKNTKPDIPYIFNKKHQENIKTSKQSSNNISKDIKNPPPPKSNIIIGVLDLEGKRPKELANELRQKAKLHINAALKITPNNNYYRKLLKELDPGIKLPIKRPCFIINVAFGDS